MSSDLGERADDYERRLVESGGTVGLIAGLVKTVERGKKVAVLVAVTLVADLVLSLVMGGVAFTAWTNSGRIQKNTALLSAESYRQCLVDQRLVAEIKDVYEVLIEGAQRSDLFTPAEKAERIERYRKAIPPVHHCPNLP